MRFIVILLLLLGGGSEEITPHWDSRIHQYAVVKATSLMPDFLQRQILKHRSEILKGVVDALKEIDSTEDLAAQTQAEFDQLLTEVNSKAPFRAICYRLGRISCFAGEVSNPLKDQGATVSANVNAFLLQRLRGLPVIVSRIDEKPFAQDSLVDYLTLMHTRNARRGESLKNGIAQESPEQWHDERSLTYGTCQLIFNDMIVDTARIWLYAWESVGGDISDAPYFAEPNQLER